MNERLKQFIEYLGFTTRQFEQKISASDGQIAKLLRQNTTMQSNTMAKIKESFPQLSLDWLVSGRGEMLRNSDANSFSKGTNSTSDGHMQSLIDILNRTLSEKDKQISQLLEIIKNFSSSDANGK